MLSIVKKLLTYFFVILGVVFFVLLLALGYLWFADPFNIRPLIATLSTSTPVMTQQEGQTNETDKHPALSEDQEQALESIGIDPEALPTTITPEMEKCFTSTLGQARVAEIKEGSTPTPVEVLKTKECY